MTGSWKGRGNQYIEFVRVLYCKLPTNGKQLPAFPLEAVTEIEPRPQRWEARVLPLCHRGPLYNTIMTLSYFSKIIILSELCLSGLCYGKCVRRSVENILLHIILVKIISCVCLLILLLQCTFKLL